MEAQDNIMGDDAFSLENREGQRMYLSCNSASSRCPSLGSSPLPPETLNRIAEIADILRRIKARLEKEGYIIADGKLTKHTSYERISPEN